jgi:uncharacterized membrane protein
MITLFITLAIIGWIISFTIGIMDMVKGWNNKDRNLFSRGGKWFIFSIPFGLVMGWLMLVGAIKETCIDKHFDNDKPGRVKG